MAKTQPAFDAADLSRIIDTAPTEPMQIDALRLALSDSPKDIPHCGEYRD